MTSALRAHADTTILVWKRRPNGSWRAVFVTVIEVVDVVVVEVDRLLHQPHAEQVETKVQILLRVIDGCGDMMQTENRMNHAAILHVAMRPPVLQTRANIRPSDAARPRAARRSS